MKELFSKILAKNESIVYNDLLHNGTSKAAEIANRTKIARNKIYDALYKLESRGLIVFERAKTKKYCIKSPEKIIEMANRKYKEQEHLLEQLRKELPRMKSLITSKAPQPYFTYTRGIEEIVKEIRRDMKPTRTFFYIFARKMTFWEEFDLIAAYRRLANKGIDIRIITADTPTSRDIVRKIGAKAVFIPQDLIIRRALVINDETAAFSLFGEHEGLRMVTDSPELVEEFKSMFLMTWRLATMSDKPRYFDPDTKKTHMN